MEALDSTGEFRKGLYAREREAAQKRIVSPGLICKADRPR